MEGPPQFKITFECASTIRTLCDVMSNMLDTVDIQVIKDDFGIMIEAIDAAQVSLVQAQLRADVVMDSTDQHCSASTARPQHLHPQRAAPLLDLHGVAARQLVDSLTAFEQLSKTSITKFTVPTLVCDQEPVRLKDQEYKYHVDIETATLKSIVRMCLVLRGETLTFTVKQRRSGDGKRARTSTKDTVLTISSNGEVMMEHTYYTSAEACEDDSMVGSLREIEALGEDDDMEVMCENQYGAKQMQDFLKSIDKHSVTLRLGQDQPLIVNHKFGNESYVCLVVAPKETGD